MIISRWRICASHGSLPLLLTATQNCPSLTNPTPAPGAVKDVVQGMYLPSLKSVLLSSSCPESFGTSTPAEPLVGGAFQSGAELTFADPGGAAAGASAGGAVGVAAAPAGAPGAVAAGGDEAQAASPHAKTNDETNEGRHAGADRR